MKAFQNELPCDHCAVLLLDNALDLFSRDHNAVLSLDNAIDLFSCDQNAVLPLDKVIFHVINFCATIQQCF